MRDVPKSVRLAEHFGGMPSDFNHRHGYGWYYKNKHFLGRDFYTVQNSANWALKKLPGRDTY